MHAEKMLMLFEPELETKRLLSSPTVQFTVAVLEVIPAQREKASPVGLVPAVNCTVGDDNNLFVSNSGSNNISIFSACIQVSATCGGGGTAPDGTLTEIPSK